MSKVCLRETNFNTEKRSIIKRMDEFVEEYQDQNLRLTLRQLYYRMIASDFLPSTWIDESYNAKNGLSADTKNTEKNYKRLGVLLADARYAGMIDWDAIEDRGRVATIWSDYEGPVAFLDQAIRGYRLPRWEGQPNYVELWVEKQALAGVLEPIASEFHATLMVNKGYSSASAMFEAANRFMQESNQVESDYYDSDKGEERNSVLLYLGDHDPSGEDMVRDIGDRLEEFGATVEVRKLALTMDQIHQYNPPPNPAKKTDSRFKKYAQEHGNESWEVDALPPNVLAAIIRQSFSGLIDIEKMNEVKAREKKHKEQLRDAAASLEADDEEDTE